MKRSEKYRAARAKERAQRLGQTQKIEKVPSSRENAGKGQRRPSADRSRPARINRQPQATVKDPSQNRVLNRRASELAKKKRSNMALMIAAGIFIIVLILFIKQRFTIAALSEANTEQVVKQKELTQKIEALETEMDKINSLEYIEEKARKELGMIKPDEKLYIEEKKDPEEEKKDPDKKTEDQGNESSNSNEDQDSNADQKTDSEKNDPQDTQNKNDNGQ